MIDTLDIQINKVPVSRISELDMENIAFARVYSDHMFQADFRNGEWGTPRIQPYDYLKFSLSSIFGFGHNE